jgi:hypothetical protein
MTDKYASASYAQCFTVPGFLRPDLLLAFEVLEHFPNPKVDIARLFSSRPRAILATTEMFSSQDKDWWYLTPESGQHIFFYTADALKTVANNFGYRLHKVGSYFLFVEKTELKGLREHLAVILTNRFAIRLARTLLAAAPAPGVWRDFENIRRNHPKTAP